MAVSTWDGSVEPVVQAEPVEQQTPSRSSAWTSEAPSRPRDQHREQARQAVPGVARQLHAVDGQQGRGEPVAPRRAARATVAGRSALDQLPAPRPCRRRPPRSPCPRGGGAPGCRRAPGAGWPCPGAATCTPTPLGPSSLWPATDSRSMSMAATSSAIDAAAWTASTWMSARPADRTRRDERRRGRDGADLVVGELEGHEAGPFRERLVQGIRVDTRVAVDRAPGRPRSRTSRGWRRYPAPLDAPRPWSRCGCPSPCPPTRRP